MEKIENKFKNGEQVYERTNPYQKLIVSRYENHIYYCRILDAPKRKELVFSERELILDDSVEDKVANEDLAKTTSFQFWSF